MRDFLNLPFSIYKDIPQWVPPLMNDERRRMDPKRFPFYKHSQAGFFLAMQGTRPVGRLAVLDNRHYNDFNHESTAFFYLFECENDLDAAAGLFQSGFDWARARGSEEDPWSQGLYAARWIRACWSKALSILPRSDFRTIPSITSP